MNNISKWLIGILVVLIIVLGGWIIVNKMITTVKDSPVGNGLDMYDNKGTLVDGKLVVEALNKYLHGEFYIEVYPLPTDKINIKKVYTEKNTYDKNSDSHINTESGKYRSTLIRDNDNKIIGIKFERLK